LTIQTHDLSKSYRKKVAVSQLDLSVAEGSIYGFLLAIYLWVSVRTKNFILPACLGIVGVVVNIVAYSNANIQKFSPWMYAIDLLQIFSKSPRDNPSYYGWSLPVVLLISVVGTLCVTLLAIADFNRRDMY
jgi:hypothetical protein